MGLNGSIEGSNPSFSASAAPAAVLRPPAEGWQSGRMRRSRKPLSVVRRIEGSNPSPSASSAGAGQCRLVPDWLPPFLVASVAILLLNLALLEQRRRERRNRWDR